MYTVTNNYDIAGESRHRTPEAAIKAARKREGDGWIVIDFLGNQWTAGFDGRAVIVRFADR